MDPNQPCSLWELMISHHVGHLAKGIRREQISVESFISQYAIVLFAHQSVGPFWGFCGPDSIRMGFEDAAYVNDLIGRAAGI